MEFFMRYRSMSRTRYHLSIVVFYPLSSMLARSMDSCSTILCRNYRLDIHILCSRRRWRWNLSDLAIRYLASQKWIDRMNQDQRRQSFTGSRQNWILSVAFAPHLSLFQWLSRTVLHRLSLCNSRSHLLLWSKKQSRRRCGYCTSRSMFNMWTNLLLSCR